MAPFDNDWFVPSSEANNRDYLPTVQAQKVRAAMAAAGIGSTEMTGTNPNIGTSATVTSGGITSYNQTSGGSGINNTSAYAVPNYYASYTHDCVQFALRSTGAYYKANDIPWRETLCGQNGTNYGTIFRIGSSVSNGNVDGITAPPQAGTAVGIGHWGGKNGLHAYNERVEPDGLIGFANRVAMVLGDAAQGRAHTYSVSGNGNTQDRMVFRLENIQNTPTYLDLTNATYTALLKEDVYISESNELPEIISSLQANGTLPSNSDTEKTFDFLFGRKFLMKGIPAGGAFELTVDKLSAPEKGFKQHLLVVGELADGSGWDVINNNPEDTTKTVAKVAPGTKFDKAVASADIVNTRIVTFLITEVSTERECDHKECIGKICEKVKEIGKVIRECDHHDCEAEFCKKVDRTIDKILDEVGCNAGIPFIALLAIIGFALRRKF
jgi:hypothetical protein